MRLSEEMLESYLKYNPLHGGMPDIMFISGDMKEYREWYTYLCETFNGELTEDDVEMSENTIGTTFIDLVDGVPHFTILLYADMPDAVKDLTFYHEVAHAFTYPVQVVNEIDRMVDKGDKEGASLLLDGFNFWSEMIAEYISIETIRKDMGSVYFLEDIPSAVAMIEDADLPEACAIVLLLEQLKMCEKAVESEELACAFHKKGYYFTDILNLSYKCKKIMGYHWNNLKDIKISEIKSLGTEVRHLAEGY